MTLIFAYLYVAFLGIGAFIFFLALIHGVFFTGKIGDIKWMIAVLLSATWCTWAAFRVYSKFIKQQREEKRQVADEAKRILDGFLESEIEVTSAVNVIKSNFSLVGLPRYHDSSDAAFDVFVELETVDFTILLFAKNGILKFWNVK